MTHLPPPTPAGMAALPPALQEMIQKAQDAETAGQWSLARAGYGEALRSTSGDLTPSLAALIARRIARCHAHVADYDAAIDSLETAEAIARAAMDRAGIGHAVNLRGVMEHQRGNVETAARLFAQADACAREAGDQTLLAMVQQNFGIVASVRGDLHEARAHYEASLETYRALGLESAVGPLLNNLGMLHADLRDWRAAEHYFAQALERAIAASDMPAVLRVEANRVEVYLGVRRFRKARRVCRKLLARVASGAEGQWIGETYKHLGVILRETGDDDQARWYFARAIEMAERRQDILLTAETHRELAVLHRRAGRTQETLAALNQAHAMFTGLSAQGDLSDVDRRLRTLEADFLEIVRRWGASIETKDRYTQGHCERVAAMACSLAADAGIDEGQLLWFRMGALLHDVGKVVIDDAVLTKPGRLTPEEWAIMQCHPVEGERLVADANFPLGVMPMIRHHHERWDGAGYPDGLAATQIPFWARILTIADVYDALTTARSYRGAFSVEQALAIMSADSGKLFDPDLMDLFTAKTMPSIRQQVPAFASSWPPVEAVPATAAA